MNITLSIDEQLAERARAVAAGRGKSLNQLIRELLEAETGLHDGEARVQALEALWAPLPGVPGAAGAPAPPSRPPRDGVPRERAR